MFTTPNKHVMSAYIPSVSMSDRPEDGDYLLCLASTSTVMTKILQLRKGSCIKTFFYTNKGTTYERGNKNNRNRKPPNAGTTKPTYASILRLVRKQD